MCSFPRVPAPFGAAPTGYGQYGGGPQSTPAQPSGGFPAPAQHSMMSNPGSGPVPGGYVSSQGASHHGGGYVSSQGAAHHAQTAPAYGGQSGGVPPVLGASSTAPMRAAEPIIEGLPTPWPIPNPTQNQQHHNPATRGANERVNADKGAGRRRGGVQKNWRTICVGGIFVGFCC